MGQDIAHEMHAAVLPSGAVYLEIASLIPLMGVGNVELHTVQPPAFQFAPLGIAQFHYPSPCFPVPLPIAVALRQPIHKARAMPGPGQGQYFRLHQPLRGKTIRFPRNLRVSTLFQHAAQHQHLVGHPGSGAETVALGQGLLW